MAETPSALVAQAPITCGACGETTTTKDSAQRGQRGLQRWDKVCTTTWRVYSGSFKKYPALKVAWDAKNGEQKEAWFRERKAEALATKGTKRRFAEITSSETSFRETSHDDSALMDWIPFTEWFLREKILSPEMTMIQATKKFNDVCSDPTVNVRIHPQHGKLLPIFRGMREASGTKQGYRQDRSNSQAVNDIASLQELSFTLDASMADAERAHTVVVNTPALAPEVLKRILPDHLVQGLSFQTQTSNKFFDQLIFTEFSAIEEEERLKVEAFDKELKQAEELVASMKDTPGDAAASSSELPEELKKPSQLKVLQFESHLRAGRAHLAAAQEAVETSSDHYKKWIENEYPEGDETRTNLLKSLVDASKNHGAASVDLLALVEDFKGSTNSNQELDASKAQMKAFETTHRTIMKDWKKMLAAVAKEVSKSSAAPVQSKDDAVTAKDCPRVSECVRPCVCLCVCSVRSVCV